MSPTEKHRWSWTAIALGGVLAAAVYAARFFINRDDKPISLLILGIVAILAATVALALWSRRRRT